MLYFLLQYITRFRFHASFVTLLQLERWWEIDRPKGTQERKEKKERGKGRVVMVRMGKSWWWVKKVWNTPVILILALFHLLFFFFLMTHFIFSIVITNANASEKEKKMKEKKRKKFLCWKFYRVVIKEDGIFLGRGFFFENFVFFFYTDQGRSKNKTQSENKICWIPKPQLV